MDYILVAATSGVICGLIAMVVCHKDKDEAFGEGVEFGVELGRAFADKERKYE